MNVEGPITMPSAFDVLKDKALAERLQRYPGNAENFRRLLEMLDKKENSRPIAFVGAGLSAFRFPDWQGILKELGDSLDREGFVNKSEVNLIMDLATQNPLAAASQLSDKLSRRIFLNKLRSIFERPGAAFTPNHRLLMRLPLKGFVTTNFDSCLDEARRAEHTKLSSAAHATTYADQDVLSDWANGDIFRTVVAPVLHIHGSISRPETLVLDENSYSKVYGQDVSGSIFRRVFEDLWVQERLLIVGFSGNDPEIRYIARKTLSQFMEQAAVDLQHVALLPRDFEFEADAQRLRQEFRDNFNAGVVFFDPAEPPGGGGRFADLRLLLQELVALRPGEAEIQREKRRQHYRADKSKGLRSALAQVAKLATAAAGRDCSLDQAFWLPQITSVLRTEGIAVQAVDQISPLQPPLVSSTDLKFGKEQSGQPAEAPNMLVVIYGDAGMGKTVLCRLLALSLAEGEAFPDLAPDIAARVYGRDIPVLLDLRRHAKELLARTDDTARAVREALIGAWGEGLARLLDDVLPAQRTLVLLDGLEALCWAASAQAHGTSAERNASVSHVVRRVLAGVRTVIPGAVLLVMGRSFTGRRLREAEDTLAEFTIMPLRGVDVSSVACVHLFGTRQLREQQTADRRFAALMATPGLRRSARTPLFVRHALTIVVEGVPQHPPERVIGAYIGHVLSRDVLDPDEIRPIGIPDARDLLRRMAVRLIERGGAVLEQQEIKYCAIASGLREDAAISIVAWLSDHTDLIILGTDGAVRFAHDAELEYLAAEALAATYSVETIIDHSATERWRPVVELAARLASSAKAEAIVGGLFRVGRQDLGLSAAYGVLRYLSESAQLRVIECIRPAVTGCTRTRLSVIKALLDVDHPEARRLLVEAAISGSPLSTAAALERYCAFKNWTSIHNEDEFLRLQTERAKRSDYLFPAAQGFIDPKLLVFGFSDEEPLGGLWASASVVLDAHRGWQCVGVLSACITDLDDDAVATIAEAALALKETTPQTKLLALAVRIEKLIFEGGEAAYSAEEAVNLLIRGLALIPSNESPAFTVGLANLALSHLGVCLTQAQHGEMVAIRRQALSQLALHARHYMECTEASQSTPAISEAAASIEDSHKETASDLASRVEATYCNAALGLPIMSDTRNLRNRSLLERYIANSGALVRKIKAKDNTGRWAYYFIFVNPADEETFLGNLKLIESIDLEDYGLILISNYGEEPNDASREILRTRYGFIL